MTVRPASPNFRADNKLSRMPRGVLTLWPSRSIDAGSAAGVNVKHAAFPLSGKACAVRGLPGGSAFLFSPLRG